MQGGLQALDAVPPQAAPEDRVSLKAAGALPNYWDVDPSHSSSSAPAGIAWFGPLTDMTGFADEGRGFLRVLERAGLDPAARDFGWSTGSTGLAADDQQMLARQFKRQPSPPFVAVHQYLPSRRQLQVEDAVNVARTMFETDAIPRAWCGLLLARDEVWVPSEHNVETYRRGGIPESKLRILGGTLDFDLFKPGAEPLDLGTEPGRFVFLSNFDFNERKGWTQLLHAWAQAFGADDPVCLVLKATNLVKGDDYVRERIEQFLRSEFGPQGTSDLAPIEIRPLRLDDPELPGLYAAADAFVLASRGEGWGRPYMEAMAMGLPTIGPDFGGSLAFMNGGNSWLFNGKLVPVPTDAEVYGGLYTGHNWLEPDVDSIAGIMQEIARDPEAARSKAEGARADLIERFGPEAIAARFTELAQDALERHLARRSKPALCTMRGPFGSNASLATVNDGIADALADRGHNVLQRPQASGMFDEKSVGISHSWPPDFDPVTFGPMVIVLPWEFGSPPQEWVEKARARADRVWVPSAYVRDGFVADGMPPGIVEVVPNGVDLERYSPEGPRRELPEAGCTFLFVGGSIWRKGVDLLLEAWTEAFGPDDDVQLVVKDFGTSSHYRRQNCGEEIQRLAGSGESAPIVYIDDDLSPDQIAELYRAADVLVTPYRGEGFCMPALEAMACGVPVIHNIEGPTSEFVPEDGGWALPAERTGLPETSKLPVLASSGYVYEIGREALVDMLRSVAGDPADRKARGLRALAAAQDYSWDSIAAIAERSLARLSDEALPLARDIAPADLECRDTLVLYAPDWSDEPTWSAALAAWASAVGPDDPVTLALQLSEGDAAALAGGILEALERAGHSEDSLPDLALCEAGSASLESLVAAADAVLIDSMRERPELTRRARALLCALPAEIADFVEALRLPADHLLATRGSDD
jgi:glycosyltransferase involved in cell wall biosynthesis